MIDNFREALWPEGLPSTRHAIDANAELAAGGDFMVCDVIADALSLRAAQLPPGAT